ncbi:MAG: SMC-Scp complex subunit ScpB [Chlamydiia bacterium]|nr:SMC-Scp complex subunit ScpB [Chlamydiia bacterium]
MSETLNFIEDRIEKIKKEEEISYHHKIKQIIEALLFASHEPIPLHKLKEIISTAYPIGLRNLREVISEMKKGWKDAERGIQIDEIGGGYLLRTKPEVAPFIELHTQNKKGDKLSKAAMEVLAIVAYKQPITRLHIEKLRGVDSSGALYNLIERNLVEVVGRLNTPGRPSQYGVTKYFLKYFGLKSLEELASKFAV